MPRIQIMAISVVVFLSLLIGGYIKEIHYFYVTFDVHLLFNRAFVIGALLGSLVGWVLAKRHANEPNERFQWFSISFLLGSSALPLLAVFSNHALTTQKVENLPVVFLKEEGCATSRMSEINNEHTSINYYVTFFLKDQTVEQIRSKIKLFPNIEQNTPVDLPIKRGFWGFDFVEITQ